MTSGRATKVVGLEHASSAQRAPTVSVIGEGGDAELILSIARRFGVPIVENPQLARALSSLELDESIPEELFQAVAILLHQITNLRSKAAAIPVK